MRRFLQRYYYGASFAKRCIHPRPTSLETETNATLLWVQVRNFCSDGFNDGGTKKTIRVQSAESPFDVLGVSKTATYAEVKQRFLKLALEHHPDHNNNNNNDKDDDNAASSNSNNEQFIRYRRAFESLKDGMDGRVVVEGAANTEESSWSSDEEFLAWYYQETRTSEDNIDLQTRKEVIEVVKKSSQSGLDRGGVWEWARRMAEEEAMALDKKHTFKRTVGLKDGSQQRTTESSGSNYSNQSPTLRRRRKKPR
jgi:hypothetical protein